MEKEEMPNAPQDDLSFAASVKKAGTRIAISKRHVGKRFAEWHNAKTVSGEFIAARLTAYWRV